MNDIYITPTTPSGGMVFTDEHLAILNDTYGLLDRMLWVLEDSYRPEATIDGLQLKLDEVFIEMNYAFEDVGLPMLPAAVIKDSIHGEIRAGDNNGIFSYGREIHFNAESINQIKQFIKDSLREVENSETLNPEITPPTR